MNTAVARQEDQPAAQVAVETPATMLREAIVRGLPPETIERFMALYERWQASEARKLFDDAIANAKAEIPPIVRNATGHNSKKYVDFAQIAKTVDPILVKHGLSYRFRSEQGERINVTCILSHRAGHSEETTLSGPADTTGNKNAVQAIGSTLTYLQRYSLIQALGLAAANDDDGKEGGAGPMLEAEDIQNLRDMMKASGCPEPHFLKWAKAEKIEDIPAAYYDSCVDAIKQYKPTVRAKA